MFFTSDRTGVRELYALELDGESAPQTAAPAPLPYLTARVATGLHEVTAIPDTGTSGRTSLVAIVIASVWSCVT